MEGKRNRKRLGKLVGMSVLTVLMSLVLTPPDIWAQSTAQISGTVTDQSGAVLPGVEVTVTQTDTGISRSAVTNETGSYLCRVCRLVRTNWKRPFPDSVLMCKPESCCKSEAIP